MRQPLRPRLLTRLLDLPLTSRALLQAPRETAIPARRDNGLLHPAPMKRLTNLSKNNNNNRQLSSNQRLRRPHRPTQHPPRRTHHPRNRPLLLLSPLSLLNQRRKRACLRALLPTPSPSALHPLPRRSRVEPRTTILTTQVEALGAAT